MKKIQLNCVACSMSGSMNITLSETTDANTNREKDIYGKNTELKKSVAIKPTILEV